MLALVSACGAARRHEAAASPVMSSPVVQYGNVSGITLVSGDNRSGGGAVLGAVIGGVIGNQIGAGSGRAAATGLGMVGGAVIGNRIDKRNDADVYRVSVRWDNGGTSNYDYQRIDDLQVGDRVKVENGQLHRL
jgi:outer membrane lipoprotein SlyB